jgi:hypothetical protein
MKMRLGDLRALVRESVESVIAMSGYPFANKQQNIASPGVKDYIDLPDVDLEMDAHLVDDMDDSDDQGPVKRTQGSHVNLIFDPSAKSS